MAPKIAEVRLDRTLYDFYSLDGGNPDEVAHVIALAPPFGSVAASLPENKKYTYQSPAAPALDNDVYARICLGNGSQNHGFVLGPLPLYLFDVDPCKGEFVNGVAPSPPLAQIDTHRVYEALDPSQRPKVSFISHPDAFKPAPSVKVSPYPPLDFLDNHPCVLSQDSHYGLLSKRDLALSDLPTPATEVIDGQISASDAQDPQAVQAESDRIIQAVRDRSLPVTIKFPQSLSGQGVFIIRDEKKRAACISLLETEVPRMIRSLTPENAHLKPVSLLLQQVVEGDTKNLSIFVTKGGRAEFVSCAGQFLDDAGIYRASILEYARQEELEEQYRETIDKIAAHVHKQGFYGPMGGDIMTDSDGQQYVVDMNVRLTGDYMMGPLRGHFYERRGLGLSYIINPLVVLGNRDQFEEMFAKELEDGQIIIIGWIRGKGGRSGTHEYSVCSVIVGGKGLKDLLQLVDRINALALAKPQ